MQTPNLAEQLSFRTTDTDIAFIAKPTYKIGVTYAKSVKEISIAVALLDTRDGVFLIHSAHILPG